MTFESSSDDTILTLSHARGLRRAADRWVNERVQRTGKNNGGPRRFGPRVRAESEWLRGMFGERVRLLGIRKRIARWAVTFPDADGAYRLHVRILRRTDHRVNADLDPTGLVATPHFVERALQSQARGVGLLIELLWDAWTALTSSPLVAAADHSAVDTSRTISIALPTCLIRADRRPTGEFVLRTVIAEPCLDYEHRLEWLALRHEQPPVEYSELDRSPSSDEPEAVATATRKRTRTADQSLIPARGSPADEDHASA